MTDTTVLARMFNNQALITLDEHYSRKKAVLVEHGTEGSVLEILGIPEDAIIIDIDASFTNTNLFDNTSGECKRADYLIISEQKRVALFIEMKKGNPDTSSIIKQLKGSLCVFEYCQVIGREFFYEPEFLGDYKKRFVAFKQVNLTQRKTKIEKGVGMHDSPESLLKIKWAKTIEFNKISA